MTKIPTVALPPEGTVDLLQGMQRYLPEEWARWASAKAANKAQQKSASGVPGGRRWPETDPKRLEAIKLASQKRRETCNADQQSAWASLIAALFTSLKSGALSAYVVPTSVTDDYNLVLPTLWQLQTKLSVRGSNIVGLPMGPVKIILWRANCGDAVAKRGPGRPPAETRDHVEKEYWQRRQSGEGLEGAHKEAAAILRILQVKHPEKKFSQNQTIAKWIKAFE